LIDFSKNIKFSNKKTNGFSKSQSKYFEISKINNIYEKSHVHFYFGIAQMRKIIVKRKINTTSPKKERVSFTFSINWSDPMEKSVPCIQGMLDSILENPGNTRFEFLFFTTCLLENYLSLMVAFLKKKEKLITSFT